MLELKQGRQSIRDREDASPQNLSWGGHQLHCPPPKLVGHSLEIWWTCDMCRGLGLDDPSSPDLEFGLASSLNPDDLSSLVSIASTTLL